MQISLVNSYDFLLYILMQLTPFLTNGFAHYYQLEESTVILGALGIFFFSFFKFFLANRLAPDGTPRSAAILFAYVP